MKIEKITYILPEDFYLMTKQERRKKIGLAFFSVPSPYNWFFNVDTGVWKGILK